MVNTMPGEALRTPIHETVPTDVAWYEGSRVWIVASPDSRLAKWLTAQKAYWDPQRRAWWIGRAKFSAELLDEIRAHVRRVNWVRELREHGVRVELDGPPERCKEIVRAHGGIRIKGTTYVVRDPASASAICEAAQAEGIEARWDESHADEVTVDVGSISSAATESSDLASRVVLALLRATPVVGDMPVAEEVTRIVVGSTTVASVRQVPDIPGLVQVTIKGHRWLVPDWPVTNDEVTITMTTQDDRDQQGRADGRYGR
jgi:hypothetical protein